MPAIEVSVGSDFVVKEPTPPHPEIDPVAQTKEEKKEEIPPAGKVEPKELVFDDCFAMHDQRNQQGMPNLPENDKTPQTRPRPEATA